MSTRRFVTSLAALAALGLVAAAGCGEQTTAIRVGDQSVSRSDFQDELEALASLAGDAPEGFPRGALEGSYDQEFVAQVANQRVQLMIFAQIFDNEGMEITDADRDQITAQLEADPAFLELPHGYRAMIIDDVTKQQLVQGTLNPQRLQDAAGAVLEGTDIEVSSRLGSWDDTDGVVRPEGPLRPGADEPLDDGLIPPPEG